MTREKHNSGIGKILVAAASAVLPFSFGGCPNLNANENWRAEISYKMMTPKDKDIFTYLDPYHSDFSKDNCPRSYIGPVTIMSLSSNESLKFEGGSKFLYMVGERENPIEMRVGEAIYVGGERFRLHALVKEKITVNGEEREFEKAIVVKEKYEVK